MSYFHQTENPNGTPRELAGFDEGPIIQVYDAV